MNADGSSDDWKGNNPNTICPTATMVQPEAQYKVITLNEGIGIDAMALERNGKFKITRRFATTEVDLSKLATDRDGIPTVNGLEAIEETLRNMPEDEKVHVLSCHTPPSMQDATSTKAASPEEVLSLIPRLVEKLVPEVVLVQVTPTTLDNSNRRKFGNRQLTPLGQQYLTLEKALMDQKYSIDAKMIDSAEIGGFVAYSEKLHVGIFYQKRVEESHLTRNAKGVTIPRGKLVAVRKSLPTHAPSGEPEELE